MRGLISVAWPLINNHPKVSPWIFKNSDGDKHISLWQTALAANLHLRLFLRSQLSISFYCMCRWTKSKQRSSNGDCADHRLPIYRILYRDPHSRSLKKGDHTNHCASLTVGLKSMINVPFLSLFKLVMHLMWAEASALLNT